jgi:hypothetical protein
VLTVVGLLELGRRDVAVLFVEPLVVEPVEVAHGRGLDLIDCLPWPVGVDQLGLVETGHGLGERIVVGVADGVTPTSARRSLNAIEVY